MKEFIITIDKATSEEIERVKYELDRECENVARQLSKDYPFNSISVQRYYDALKERVIRYDELKDELSDNIVIPNAVEKWGPNASIAWSLDFHTANITVTLINTETRTVYDAVADIEQKMCDRMRYLSVNTKVCEEISDRIDATYPTIDNSAYNEFIKFKAGIDEEYKDKKALIELKYAQPWVNENLNGYTGKFDWKLIFDSAKITISA